MHHRPGDRATLHAHPLRAIPVADGAEIPEPREPVHP